MWRVSIFIALILAGCSTPYQEMGLDGGVSAEQMTSNTFRISARGNELTSSTRVQDYLMLKAAETTVQRGGTHFVIIDAADASSTSQIVTGGTSTTTFYGNTATTAYTPPMVLTSYNPGQDAYIRVLKVAPGQAPPHGAIAASEIIKFVGPRAKAE